MIKDQELVLRRKRQWTSLLRNAFQHAKLTLCFICRFFEYKVVWPNRGGGFGITEIVDVVNLQSEDARKYHEPRVLDTSIFFPMNWTFQLTCDRIRPDDCVFNPVSRVPPQDYNVQLNNLQVTMKKEHNHPEFVVESIYSSQVKIKYQLCRFQW